MKIVIDQCSGIAPRIPPARLSAAGAQAARNVDVRRQTLQPLRSAGSLAVQLPDGMDVKTVYKWGGTLSERMWFAWESDVDVCRGQIAGDDLEWTIFTGDGYPKITNANMYGLASAPEPPPYEPYEPYDPYEPPADSGDPLGTRSITQDEVYASYTNVSAAYITGPISGSWHYTTFQLLIVPLEEAFALATDSVEISDGAIATDYAGSDFSGVNAALNGTYASLAEFESAVVAAAPSDYSVEFKPKDQGRVLSLHHSYISESFVEEITVGSPFAITWGST